MTLQSKACSYAEGISVEVKRVGEALIGDIKSEHFAFLLQLSILFQQLQLMWLCKVVSLGTTWLNFPQNMMQFLLIRISGVFLKSEWPVLESHFGAGTRLETR